MNIFAVDHAAVLIAVLALIAGVALHVLRRRRRTAGKGSIDPVASGGLHSIDGYTLKGPRRLPRVEVIKTLKEIWTPDDLDNFEIPDYLRKSPTAGGESHPAQPTKGDTNSPRLSEQDYSATAVPSVWRTRREPPEASKDEWGFHITDDFRKAVRDLDKSMRGRVLDAITEICQHPMEVRGDTIKPLSGELAGCWRYRLGDYRLVYQPIKDVRRIDLLTIGGRGSIYLH